MSTTRRRSRSALEEDDSDVDTVDGTEPASPKRMRRTDSIIDDNTPEPSGYVNGDRQHEKIAKVSEDDYAPGAIIRVSVKNFVTYEKADFFPGPNLNMVIGPNGTGKSSLVCAICLGLGYAPKHLGRAGSVKEFVKHGKDMATIEIELRKREKDRRNYIIKVQIRREQNSQKWWLNGKESSHKNIQTLMRELKIQVDNLCQFLPQDRVVEFAACTPVDLLHETLRAAAPEEMLEWQSKLQGLHAEKKEMTATNDADKDYLANLENRQQGLQADVDRLREREEIQKNVENLKSAHKMALYQDARQAHVAAKAKRDEAKRALKRLEHNSGPSLQAVKDKQDYATRVQAVIPLREKAAELAKKDIVALAAKVSSAASEVKDANHSIEAERKGFANQRKEMGTIKATINNIQAKLRKTPPPRDWSDVNHKIRSMSHEERELGAEDDRLKAQIHNISEEGKAKRREIQTTEKNIESFNTQQGQQMALMQKNFPEHAKGWEWVQEHQNEFEKEIFGPAMVTCSIKDERYSDQVQSVLGQEDFTCFTAQTTNDLTKLNDQLLRTMSLSVATRSCANPLSSFKTPVALEEARRLGMEGFAIDYVDGPEPVLAMLCASSGLHRAGISLQEHTDQQYEAIVQSGAINSWSAGKTAYNIRRRREYGPGAVTTVTKPVKGGRFWKSQPLDSAELNEYKRRLAQASEEFARLKSQSNDSKTRKGEIEEKRAKLRTEIETLQAEKNELQREWQRFNSLPDQLEAEETKKKNCENEMNAIRGRISELNLKYDKATVKRAELALQHANALEQCRIALDALVETKIWHLEAESDLEGLTARNASIMQQLDDQKRVFDEAAAEAETARTMGKEYREAVEIMMGENPSEEWRATITDLCQDKSAPDLVVEYEAEESKLELIQAANPSIMREFERRAADIDRLKRKQANSQEKLQRLNEGIEALMAKWEPELDKLIDKIDRAFAHNFEQIQCAGEVRVHKADDFDLWAIDILVKFRESEELQQLTAHRQSGGERAVSTIFYLMALQSMAQSPFRVVDEINQGMDPRNERMVHERMVDIACKEHSSQYFLITPKLLTGLRYDSRMRVLCIASGEHMPEDGERCDFRECLKVQKMLLRA
ncbi:structural maintenance of chromosome complex subunit SmcA [Emericellopsis atlantica]|uniref:Structural maintenance of chromosomes protein 5 n=1 Tax=Emericellopsis atlantica TaxID=2614577 RepID=A0A9P7ZW22_9HYPO|nr:structural maintenance of chromosome complex subunit SmcA [Emericellopsis atlantica]KAG9258725.1 structural maintenance of chromosome complex subunit SmcA [Emericellopsis atlantica]